MLFNFENLCLCYVLFEIWSTLQDFRYFALPLFLENNYRHFL